LIRKKKRKPLRGTRKIHFRELPWMTYLKGTAVILIAVALIYQFFTLRYHAARSSEVLSNNLQLNEKVSELTTDLSQERVSFETFITTQLERIVELDTQIGELSTALESTQTENFDLLTQLDSARKQNDVLRNKLDTIMDGASRNGAELTPSAVGTSGLTLAELQKMTSGTPLAGIEPALLQIEKDYNVNALFALAVAKLETGIGTSFLVKEHNNLFAMRGRSGWFTYATKNDSVLAFGKLMATNYFNKGYNTLDKIGPRYAEGSTSWALKAKYHMITDMRKIH
jgi:flagellum-specific peptidoglycan hydrolase FlgJ